MFKFLLFLIIPYMLLASQINMAMTSMPSRLNPLLATDSASSEISGWLFSALVKYDKNGFLVPELASSYKFINSTTVEFIIKDGAKWSDGVNITADDAVFTFNTITSPKLFTPYSTSFRKVASVEAKDGKTVVVKYKEPYFKAIEIWTMPLLPKHILQNDNDLMTSKFNSNPIGNGAYTLGKSENSQNIVLNANPLFLPHPAKISKINYVFLPDPSTEFLMLKTAKLDIGGLSPLQLERQIDKNFKKQYQIIERPGSSYSYLGFNLRLAKFQDKRVREALSLAIDRQELADILYLGHAKVATGPFLPGSFAYNENIKPPQKDIKRAKELLKAAGYNEKNPLSFEIVTNSNNQIRVYATEMLRQQFAEVGVKVTTRSMEWQAFLNMVVSPRKFETVLLGWSMPLMPDAYPIWHSEKDGRKGGFNLVGYKNLKVDELINKAEKSVDMSELSKLYKEMFAEIVSDTPYLFLFTPNQIMAVDKKISPIEPSIIGIMHNQIEWEIKE
ncbi:MAG: hypothetical protein RL154_1674 [Pseudomonadota bacterium]|jgi:peptide/nickel transport system substrate-binding protein